MQMEDTDKLPKGKKPCLSLRELEKQVNTDLDLLVNIVDGQMTVCELVDRYLKTKTGVRQSTKQGYVTVQRLLAKEAFGKKTIRSVKTSGAKLFLIKLQQEDGKSYSSIHTIRGVLRPAFQMAVDDDILVKNPFGFQLAGVLVNDAVTREAITKDAQLFRGAEGVLNSEGFGNNKQVDDIAEKKAKAILKDMHGKDFSEYGFRDACIKAEMKLQNVDKDRSYERGVRIR